MSNKQKALYDDGKIKISRAESPDEHDVLVDEQYAFLPRGVLKEWAEADAKRIREGLGAMGDYSFLEHVENAPGGIERLGWAIAKARIRELEEEVSYFARQSREKSL